MPPPSYSRLPATAGMPSEEPEAEPTDEVGEPSFLEQARAFIEQRDDDEYEHVKQHMLQLLALLW